MLKDLSPIINISGNIENDQSSKGEIMLSQSNRVIVRVWTNNVGHISIETPREYMSLWPVPFTEEEIRRYRDAGTLDRKWLHLFMERAPDFHQNYEEDATAEGVPPEFTICFYALEIKAMEARFRELSTSTEGWRLIGRNLFFQAVERGTAAITMGAFALESTAGRRNVDNCASLALQILYAGDVDFSFGASERTRMSSQTSSVVRPADILDLVILAKRAELKVHPETETFQYATETRGILRSASCCTVM
jgi:hypothetical protein